MTFKKRFRDTLGVAFGGLVFKLAVDLAKFIYDKIKKAKKVVKRPKA